jgi:hypothetical protein
VGKTVSARKEDKVPDETKVLYSNGPKRVEATADAVTFADERIDATVTFSHAEMREIVLGWGRHEARERE